MDFKIFTLKITGKRTGTKTRKRRTLRRLEVKSLLLQVDQALGSSQCLLMGTLANFTLSKRREILEKSSVNETVPLLREVSATYKGATTYLRDLGFLAPLKPPF
jgi:hypothetical protein